MSDFKLTGSDVFGRYCRIEQFLYGKPNEMHLYKVIASRRTNTWCEVPYKAASKEVWYDRMEDCILAIHCGIDETKVQTFRAADVEFLPRKECDREALIELADRMEGYARFCKERSIQVGNNLVECYARRIREALGACEACPDAPAAVDDEQTATDAHEDEEGASAGYYEGYVHPVDDDDYAACCWVRENGGLDAVKARMMPEGMEWLLDVWPKWSNGEYCKFGDWWKSDEYGEFEPQQFSKLSIYTPEQLVEWGQGDGDHFGYEWDFVRPSDPTYRPDKSEPPAPKVLDADWVEIRVGEKLYDVETGCKRTVRAVNNNGTIEFDGYANRGWFAKFFTHRAPVLAADGRPLKEGEHVYHVETGAELVVKELPKPGEYQAVVAFAPPASRLTSFDPDRLTHERPDSWEQLEEDCSMNTGVYTRERMGIDVEKVPAKESRRIDMMRDLVRRAKALAERGA